MIRILFAIFVGALVLSLPVWKTALGAKLRRIAGFALALALMPSIVVGLFFPEGSAPHPAWLLVLIPLLVAGAYGALRLRHVTGAPQRPQRPNQKMPIDRLRRQEQEFFSFIADRQAERAE